MLNKENNSTAIKIFMQPPVSYLIPAHTGLTLDYIINSDRSRFIDFYYLYNVEYVIGVSGGKMKNILAVALLITFVAAPYAAVTDKKPYECPMAKAKKCSGICPEKMKGVQTVSQNITNGVVITITTKNKEMIAKVQELAVVHYNSEGTMEKSCPGKVAGAEIKLINTSDGVNVEITGKTPETVKKIQEASMKEHKQAAARPEAGKTAPAKEAKKTTKYICPMSCPGGESSKPGKCPKCGMDLKEKK